MNIKLTKGLYSVIDDEDFFLISGCLWRALSTGRKKDVYYAVGETSTKGDRKTLLMHRLVMGAKKGEIVDHINHDTLDNRKKNLRIGTLSLNQLNKKGHALNYKKYTNLKGAYFNKRDQIWFTRFKGKYVGECSNAEEAARAYDRLIMDYNPEWALTNKNYIKKDEK